MFPAATESQCRGVTNLLVMQATPFCNIDCDYCYLPNRNQRDRMSFETVSDAITWVYRNGLARESLSVVWHAGEPLVLSPDWYRKAIRSAAKALPPGATLQHCMQTNGMLVTDAWCDLFVEASIQVGVSLDGPAQLHDARRRTRAGQGTHAAALRGVATLRRRGVPLHAICVVTEATLSGPEDLVDFFANLGVSELGLNIEEVEGVNLRSTLQTTNVEQRFRIFFERAVDRSIQQGVLLREVRNVLAMLPRRPAPLWPGNDSNTPFANITIGWDGSINTFSPELAGFNHAALGSMVLGHVAKDTLSDILVSQRFLSLWSEIATGVEACAQSCAYFPLCGGGEPSNKLAELGTFAGTETLNCRLIRQQVAETILTRMLQSPHDGGPPSLAAG